ncbi:ralA-binding protein 1 isoform X1 [Nematostella vectensis]|uniref:ralA-binding protein 1 isoform X1 n=1 Tax=Nematostella vectensis TaxID=45351 RepID=UPI00207787A8|nr:ralA-binding protein 1 isoform X1 [Nematostella vectensis]
MESAKLHPQIQCFSFAKLDFLLHGSSEHSPKGKKVKREKSRTLALPRIKAKKHQKKKEKEKEKEKDKKKKKSETPSSPPPKKPIFGIPLEKAVKQSILPDGVELPRLFREGIMYVEENGLNVEGIYRVSGVKSKVDALKELYDQGKQVDLKEYEPEVVASIVKQYLRELPESVLTMMLAPRFNELIGIQDKKEQLEKTKQLLAELPSPNRTLLAWTMVHMGHVIDKASENKMSLQNISIVLNPTMSISHGVLFIFLSNLAELFPNTQLTSYNGPLTFRLEEDEADLPSSPDAIATALAKQEAILANLHKELNASKDDNSEGQDELLWEVQRKVTQLKRKLRVARRSSESKLAEEQRKSAKSEAEEHDELIKLLEASEAELLIEQEELTATGAELRKQLQAERSEIERLTEEISLVLADKDADPVFSDNERGSESSGSDTEVDEVELDNIYKDLVKQNEELEVEKNTKLCHDLHDQREACAELKVQIRIFEQRGENEARAEQDKPQDDRVSRLPSIPRGSRAAPSRDVTSLRLTADEVRLMATNHRRTQSLYHRQHVSRVRSSFI